jgi:hypothetical protein
MVIQIIASDVIGTLGPQRQDFVFSISEANGNGQFQVSGGGFSTEKIVSDIASIRLGEKKSISSVALSTSRYHLNQPFELSCEPEIIEFQHRENEYLIMPKTIGRTELCIVIEGFEPIRQEINIKSPPLPGVPAYWDASSPYVLLPKDLVPSSEIEVDVESDHSNGKQMNRCKLRGHYSVVPLMKNSVHVHTMQVRYHSSRLFNEVLEISCFQDEPPVDLPTPLMHQENLSWFDTNEVVKLEHTTSSCGETTYALKGINARGELSEIVDESGELLRCHVSTLKWDFNEIAQRDIRVEHFEIDDSVVMRVRLPRPREYPGHLLEGLVHSLSPDEGFQVERSEEGHHHIAYYVKLTSSGEYSTTLTLASATYDVHAEVEVHFDEALDFSEQTLSEVEIRAFVAKNRVIAIEYSTQLAELEHMSRFKLQLLLNDKYLMCLYPNQSKLLFPIHSRPILGDFCLVAPWHPYFSRVEFVPKIEIVHLEYSVDEFTLQRPELVAWKPTLHQRMKLRAEGTRPPSKETFKHRISRVGEGIELGDIHSEHFYPVIIAFPYNHPPGVFTMFDLDANYYIGESGTLTLFEDEDKPLILPRGDWVDGRRLFLQNGDVVFKKPGVYILALCPPFVRLRSGAIKSGENWCGEDGDDWGFRYADFTEIEVI